jgi:hypothetical protein
LAFFTEGRGYLSKKFKIIPVVRPLSINLAKASALFLVIVSIVGLGLVWLPSYHKLQEIQKERISWESILNRKNTYEVLSLPTTDQILNNIEQCRSVFQEAGIVVESLNVERFGNQDGQTSDGAGLEYILVRLHLKGDWETIIAQFRQLEQTHKEINVQEITFESDGAEGLLQIYFYTAQFKQEQSKTENFLHSNWNNVEPDIPYES